jgi:hypothetical protein
MAVRTPPRFVPTLTEVVQNKAAAPAPAPEPLFMEEQLVHRVLQRVDLVLERRLRETIATVVLEHTQALAPQLRDRIELAVRDAVTQALADEITAQALADAGTTVRP